jgi:F-type H+-transporting ATPase subunit epsilon
MSLTLEIVTPEARVYSDTVDTVVIPTVEGEIGILPGHIPLLTQVGAGELRVLKNGKTELLAVGNGFAEIDGDKVSILAESAITEEKIDEAAAENAMRRAEESLHGKDSLDAAEVERLESIVRSAVVQLDLKRRRRH